MPGTCCIYAWHQQVVIANGESLLTVFPFLMAPCPKQCFGCCASQGSCCYVDLEGTVVRDTAELEKQLTKLQAGVSTSVNSTVQLLETDHVFNPSAQHTGETFTDQFLYIVLVYPGCC